MESNASALTSFCVENQWHAGRDGIHLRATRLQGPCVRMRRPRGGSANVWWPLPPNTRNFDADMPDTYRIIEAGATATRRVEGSRFLAEALPVDERKEAEDRIEAVRAREPKATHHCSAYRVGPDGEVFHYDDDGEPSGTAGRPILRHIEARSLTNTLVVVTRYFGGTELGTGGLARAYGAVASEVLDRAEIVERVPRVPIRLQYAYDDTAPAERVLAQFDTRVRRSKYTDVTVRTVAVPRSEEETFVEAFIDALGGRGTVERLSNDT